MKIVPSSEVGLVLEEDVEEVRLDDVHGGVLVGDDCRRRLAALQERLKSN